MDTIEFKNREELEKRAREVLMNVIEFKKGEELEERARKVRIAKMLAARRRPIEGSFIMERDFYGGSHGHVERYKGMVIVARDFKAAWDHILSIKEDLTREELDAIENGIYVVSKPLNMMGLWPTYTIFTDGWGKLANARQIFSRVFERTNSYRMSLFNE